MALTKSDLNQIKDLLNQQETRFEKKLGDSLFKQEMRFEARVVKLEEKFEKTVFRYKSDFFDKIDPVLKEVTVSREERATDSEQHQRLDGRIEVLEKIHPHSQHLAILS